jgi:hypothetical protein
MIKRFVAGLPLLMLSPLALAGEGPPAVIPEPETLALLAVGAIALAIVRLRRRK